jgi:hypothetical protein
MTALLRKELRQLLPVAVLVAIAMTMNLPFMMVSARLDELSWTGVTDGLESGDGLSGAIVILFLGLITSYSLFPREHDDHTIEFLHSLPVVRWKIFAAKVLSALFILIGGIALGMAVDASLPLFNTQTFSGNQFRLDTAMRLFFLFSVFSVVVVSHGVLISFFRRFGLVLYGIAWWIIWSLEHGERPLPWVNFLAILECEYFGTRLLIPWGLVTGHLLAALVALGLAYVLWILPADGAMSWHRKLSMRFWGKLALVAGTIGVVALAFSIAYRMDVDHGTDDPPPVYYRPFPAARYITDHYQFTYPANLRSTALPLIQSADEAFQRVRALLFSEARPEIVVDLTEESTDHAGIAGLKKIRMDIQSYPQPEMQLRVLHHETTHVFQAVESNLKLNEYMESTLFFSEGLADHVGFLGVPDQKLLSLQRLVGAVAWERLGIRFEEMADTAIFRRTYDENLLYSLGEMWVHALAQVCGEEAPGDTIRSLGRDQAPDDLQGTVLWQDTLQTIECDLEAVNGRWQQEMSELASREEAAEIPRISGGVSKREGETITLVAYLDRPVTDDTLRVAMRVRNSESDGEEDVRTRWGEVREGTSPAEVEFEVSSYYLDGRRFDFQFGYFVAPGIPLYYERWQSAHVPASD